MTDLPTLAVIGLFLILVALAGAVLFRIAQQQFSFKAPQVPVHTPLHRAPLLVANEEGTWEFRDGKWVLCEEHH